MLSSSVMAAVVKVKGDEREQANQESGVRTALAGAKLYCGNSFLDCVGENAGWVLHGTEKVRHG